MLNKIKLYYNLTKPGIIYGNDISATAGFLLASSLADSFDFGLLVATLLGISLVIACGCVVNNYIDRGLDQKMARTQKRALVSGEISTRSALIYGVVLGLLGFLVLTIYTNFLTVLLGMVGLFSYLVLYSVGKRQSEHGTLIGTIAGATPIVAGYCAVTNSFDAAALLLFLAMAFWQMPHFYAIAMFRAKDYAAAGLPVLPVKKGVSITKLQIVLYIVAFIVEAAMLSVLGYTGNIYLAVMLAVGLYWLYKAYAGIKAKDSVKWARGMFGFSLIVLLTFSFMLSVGALLP